MLALALLASASASEPLSGRWANLGSRSPAAAAPALSTSAVTSGGGWPTEHHDTLNSASTQYLGPVGSGDCLVPFFDLPEDTAVRFYSTGVTAAAASVSAASNYTNAHFFAGSDNALRVVVNNGTIFSGNSTSTYLTTSSCPLTPLRAPGAPPPLAGNTGVVASGTSWVSADGRTERFAVASTDGTVYALNWQSCVNSTAFCNTTSRTVLPRQFLGALEQGSEGQGQGAATAAAAASSPCLAWNFTSPRRYPFLTPPRYIYSAPTRTSLLLVTDTAPGGIYTGATTYALNSETGALVWNHSHTAFNNSWYGSVGTPPAYDSVDDIVFLAYGPGLVAIRGDGKQLGTWGGAGDVVVASPSVSVPDNGAGTWSIFLHTSLGSLWRVDVDQDYANDAVTFDPIWRCDYSAPAYLATGGKAGSTCTSQLTGWAGLGGEELVAAPLLAAGAAAAAAAANYPAPRSDFAGAGGLYPPTSAAQRAALWAAVRARYAAAHPAGPPSPLLPAHTAGLPPGTDTAPLEAALMLAALPREAAAAVLAGADWAGHADPAVAGFALFTGGAPSSGSLGEYVSSYPYAAPTLLNSGGQLALSQFTALGGAATGLLIVRTDTGALSWAYTNTTISGAFGTSVTVQYGRSRSTPSVDGRGNLFGECASGAHCECKCARHALAPACHTHTHSPSTPTPHPQPPLTLPLPPLQGTPCPT
jgi:hypothetical protein